METKKPWIKLGSILKKKDGSGNYVKLDISEGKNKLDKITLNSGDFITVQNPRKRKGITDEELQKIPDWVVAELFIAPPRD